VERRCSWEREKKKSCWLTNVRFEQWKASGPLRNRRRGAAPPTVPHLGESVRIAYRHRIGSARVRGRLKEHTANIEQLRCALSVPHLGDVAALSAGMAAP
jgi:hypothetical protein